MASFLCEGVHLWETPLIKYQNHIYNMFVLICLQTCINCINVARYFFDMMEATYFVAWKLRVASKDFSLQCLFAVPYCCDDENFFSWYLKTFFKYLILEINLFQILETISNNVVLKQCHWYLGHQHFGCFTSFGPYIQSMENRFEIWIFTYKGYCNIKLMFIKMFGDKHYWHKIKLENYFFAT